MILPQIFKCDICGAAKQEANHWYVITRKVDRILLAKFNDVADPHLWDEHYCGRECRDKAIAKWDEEGK